MRRLLALLALSGCAVAPPDVSECYLGHAFVLGEAFRHPGAIEIWGCPRNAVVTLLRFDGPWNDPQQRYQSHLATELAPDEWLVACREEDGRYWGVVAVTSDPESERPKVSRAWQADLRSWTFEQAVPALVVCRR